MMDRRTLLLNTARSALLLAWGHGLVACSREPGSTAATPTAPPAEPVKTLDQYAATMQAVSYIGVSCRKPLGLGDLPDDQLRVALEAELEPLATPFDTPEALRARVDELIRADFDAGAVIEVEAWRLSRTECLLAALAALAQGYETAQVPEQPKLRIGTIVEVEDWGPKSTRQGQPFNQQSDGHSGMWFKARGAPASVVLMFDGRSQTTQVYAEHLTSGIRGAQMEQVLNNPGAYEVALFDKATMTRQPVGEFVVEPAPEAAPFAEACRVEAWGPDRAVPGQPFNEQPDGASAFWIRTNCARDGSVVQLDGVALKTTVRDGLLTASAPNGHELAPGEHAVTILVGGTGETLQVGILTVAE